MKNAIELLQAWKYLLVWPHLIVYSLSNGSVRHLIDEDLMEMNRRRGTMRGLAYFLIYEKPYRNLFYYRVGKVSRLLKRILPKYRSFFIGNIDFIGGGAFVLNHPFSTIINAKRIGNNFTICQLTTIGNAIHGRNDLIPSIGNDVSVGANVSIIGDITIGDHVVIGAGSVVVKDVPNNCVVAGNPARIIRFQDSNE